MIDIITAKFNKIKINVEIHINGCLSQIKSNSQLSI